MKRAVWVAIVLTIGLGWLIFNTAEKTSKKSTKRGETLQDPQNRRFASETTASAADPETLFQEKSSKRIDTLPNAASSETAVAAADDGPPFREHCLCSFNDIARIRVNTSRYDIILSGKGWGPQKAECAWIWDEEISNEVPPDSLITEQRIYLVDLPVPVGRFDTASLSSSAFRQRVIALAIYRPDASETEHLRCFWDPYRTGKYPKPPHWVE